jgi:hypothetical protein
MVLRKLRPRLDLRSSLFPSSFSSRAVRNARERTWFVLCSRGRSLFAMSVLYKSRQQVLCLVGRGLDIPKRLASWSRTGTHFSGWKSSTCDERAGSGAKSDQVKWAKNSSQQRQAHRGVPQSTTEKENGPWIRQ